MSKKLIIVLVVLIGIGALLYWKMNMQQGRTVGGVVTYTCAAGKSFSLTYTDADTVRLSGTGVTSMTLDETAVGYWISADGKVVAKTAGNFVVLVQNDKISHDECVVATK